MRYSVKCSAKSRLVSMLVAVVIRPVENLLWGFVSREMQDKWTPEVDHQWGSCEQEACVRLSGFFVRCVNQSDEYDGYRGIDVTVGPVGIGLRVSWHVDYEGEVWEMVTLNTWWTRSFRWKKETTPVEDLCVPF